MTASGADAMAEEFLQGERYLKSPGVVEKSVAGLPIADIPARYVIFKPLGDVDLAQDNVRSITYLVNPDQLSARRLSTNRE